MILINFDLNCMRHAYFLTILIMLHLSTGCLLNHTLLYYYSLSQDIYAEHLDNSKERYVKLVIYKMRKIQDNFIRILSILNSLK